MYIIVASVSTGDPCTLCSTQEFESALRVVVSIESDKFLAQK